MTTLPITNRYIAGARGYIAAYRTPAVSHTHEQSLASRVIVATRDVTQDVVDL